jgi:regulatory protein
MMATITALTAQKRNHDRVNVYLDGAFAFGLPAITAARLKVGQTLSPEEVAALQHEDRVEKARQSAIRFIGYRPRSVMEVRRNLRDKDYDEPVIEYVLERLQAVELLDDVAFAHYWVEQRETFKPRSQMALRLELQQKGVARDVIEKALAKVDETAAARRAAEKQARRWLHLPEDAFRARLAGFLQRRGFNYGVIDEITNELWESIADDTTADMDAT